MMLIDANILIYAHVSSFVQHDPARDWLDQQLNASIPVGLPWVSLLAFLRLVTNPRVFEKPEPTAEAWQQVRSWLASDTAWVPQPKTYASWLARKDPVTGRNCGGIRRFSRHRRPAKSNSGYTRRKYEYLLS
jgi:toxin-antitoxin system PIN domain toxin